VGLKIGIMSLTRFSPSPPIKEEEGRGEEAKTDSKSTPLTPALSPFGRGVEATVPFVNVSKA
jgi:hypothetical protein